VISETQYLFQRRLPRHQRIGANISQFDQYLCQRQYFPVNAFLYHLYQRIGDVTKEDMAKCYEVNAIGHLMVAQVTLNLKIEIVEN
jgi:hypothetical protein